MPSLRNQLGRDLGSDLLAGLKDDVASHLDPFALAIPDRNLLVPLDLEVSAQLAVDDGEDIAVELCGNARRIVIRGDQDVTDDPMWVQHRIVGVQCRPSRRGTTSVAATLGCSSALGARPRGASARHGPGWLPKDVAAVAIDELKAGAPSAKGTTCSRRRN